MSGTKGNSGYWIRHVLRVAFYLWSACIFAFPLVIVLALIHSKPNLPTDVTSNAADYFTRYTGLTWPDSATVLLVEDSKWGGREGSFHILFSAEEKTLKSWLAGPPPWEKLKWQRGPVPVEIGSYDRLVKHRDAMDRVDLQVERAWNAKETWYSTDQTCSESTGWQSGKLLVITPRKRLVCLSVWQ
ncbi:MAG: hypothetical protein HY318_09285 [Armatimonadetes bacterium]|nr:hypothetical protein [Armatimonadota bacterium]